MANQIYGYNSSYGGTGLSYSSKLSSGSVRDQYLSDPSLIGSSRYLSSDPLSSVDSSNFSVVDRGSMLFNQSDSLRFSGGGDLGGIGGTGGFSASRIPGGIGAAAAATLSLFSQTSWPGADGVEPAVSGIRWPAEAIYHQTFLGKHNIIGQSEALFPTSSLTKRPRFESASNLPIYPQRPGEKDCAHYMLTRTCKFGDGCKFDHPLWVTEGGIPDWKEVPDIATSESPPERPGEPDCPYFLKTQRCKFGLRCKFNHPKDKVEVLHASIASETADVSVLPERPLEPICSYYVKTGKCKFGASCKFHHPKDIQIACAGQDPGSGEQIELASKDGETEAGDAKPVKPFVPLAPALLHNSKGLPIRPGEVDCPFYLKTGSCKYGATCRYNHPDRNALNPLVAAALGHAIIPYIATNPPIGAMNSAVSSLSNIDPRLAQTTVGLGPTIYPQRPGQTECDFYMKTGECKFGERCKFHHPIDQSEPTPSMMKHTLQQNVKLTLAGLPRRVGAIICPFYMKTGTCKYGSTCRFDHPPPGEVVAMAAAQSASGGEERDPETAV
ncbi:zinc finger CCCH domain-containing protein 37-like isoform X2 [Magnolia sinica]|uniref:zinc finger CCCH domain-containing protein 37-like isoform X2 n=1 Tax=Magnolia sinica TaxID=86752 RepID=UPI00265A48A5|nr:zinc finger CCCH domain-containing protein 37-like isoform X2 [Magnolia sinica]